MKQFEKPEFDIAELSPQDVISTSNERTFNDEGGDVDINFKDLV